jgi:hypothetical protein
LETIAKKVINLRPFVKKNAGSWPLKISQTLTVVAIADEDECLREMFVEIEYEDDTLSVPLSQIAVISENSDTRQAVEDWHYWIAKGYRF